MSPAGLIDTHAHLMDPTYDADRQEVISRAHQAGVAAMLLVGYDVTTSRAAVELARELPNARAAVGIHPNSASAASESDFAEIAELARAPEVVAIGETGLDNYREFTPRERQRHALEWHVRLAADRQLPLIIHNRDADTDIGNILVGARANGILHCFSSTDLGYLERMLAEGFFVSFAGPITFKNGAGNRAMATRVTRERLLVETDCPYLAPEPHRGRRNEPAYVRDTAACLASVLDVPLVELTERLWHNTLQVVPAFAQLEVSA